MASGRRHRRRVGAPPGAGISAPSAAHAPPGSSARSMAHAQRRGGARRVPAFAPQRARRAAAHLLTAARAALSGGGGGRPPRLYILPPACRGARSRMASARRSEGAAHLSRASQRRALSTWRHRRQQRRCAAAAAIVREKASRASHLADGGMVDHASAPSSGSMSRRKRACMPHGRNAPGRRPAGPRPIVSARAPASLGMFSSTTMKARRRAPHFLAVGLRRHALPPHRQTACQRGAGTRPVRVLFGAGALLHRAHLVRAARRRRGARLCVRLRRRRARALHPWAWRRSARRAAGMVGHARLRAISRGARPRLPHGWRMYSSSISHERAVRLSIFSASRATYLL